MAKDTMRAAGDWVTLRLFEPGGSWPMRYIEQTEAARDGAIVFVALELSKSAWLLLGCWRRRAHRAASLIAPARPRRRRRLARLAGPPGSARAAGLWQSGARRPRLRGRLRRVLAPAP